MKLPRIQFITQESERCTHLDCVNWFCQGGAKFIQLRLKVNETDRRLELAREAKEICEDFGALLIVNDYVELAVQVSAAGVHLGRLDRHPEEAREILGDEILIGATVNSEQDIARLKGSRIDYVGLGPLRFTSTKQNLSAPLGFEGIVDLLGKIGSELRVPAYAIGGVAYSDLLRLESLGVYGAAISSAVISDPDPVRTVRALIEFYSSNSKEELGAYG